jgi:hypothetical protein
MSDFDPVSILESGVDAWNQWRRDNPAERPSLSGIDFSDRDLTGVNLHELDLTDADFYGATLSQANLKMATLTGCDLADVTAVGVDLYKVDLQGSFMTGANLSNAYLNESQMGGADLRGANLSGAKLEAAVLVGCDLSGADLSDAILDGADVTDSNLSRSDIDRASLFGLRYESTKPGIDQNSRRFLFKVWQLIGYGRSLGRLALYAFVLAMAFGVLYSFDQALAWGLMDYSGSAGSPLTPFYYSIVTYTTLGFGDITPQHWLGEVIIVIEVLLGYTTLGLLLAILGNRVARQS